MKRIIIILLIILSFSDVYTQAPTGEIEDFSLLPGMDTVFVTRRSGDWWFGITGGVNGSMYFSDFYLPERPFMPLDTFNVLIDFPASLGSGLFLGLTGDWIPNGEKWGASLNIYLLDYRASSVESEPFDDSVNTRYQSTYSNSYIAISPSARYNTSIGGLHLYGGFDIELNMNSEISHRKTFDYTAEIDHDIKFDSSSFTTRFGFHAGVGYDILLVDINNRMRLIMTPYAMLHGGTAGYKDFGSSRNNLMLRAGVSFKLGFDDIDRDTVLFDPTYEIPPAMIADAKSTEIEFPEVETSKMPTSELAYVQRPVGGDAEPSPREVAEEATARIEEETPEIDPNEVAQYSFNNNLTDDLQLYLDGLANYLEENPGSRISIVGHSDNRGSQQQNFDRSLKRANKVRNYLISKGIDPMRLLATGRGALDPEEPNTTAAGRAANRRVEIEVIR